MKPYVVEEVRLAGPSSRSVGREAVSAFQLEV